MQIRFKLKKKSHRKLIVSTLVFFIISIGIFKSYVVDVFNLGCNAIFSLFGKSSINYIEKYLFFLTENTDKEFGLGALLFHCLYLLMHFLLIRTLFYEHPKLVKLLTMVLFLSIVGLALLTIIFKLAELTKLFDIALDLFRQLAGRPLILFLIEGGGLIFKHLEQKGYIEQ